MGSLAERFDVIECSGRAAPPEGPGRRLADAVLAAASGRCDARRLYSEIARQHVVRAREFVATEGFAATPDPEFARAVPLTCQAERPAVGGVARGGFLQPDGFRDLMFHVQEQRFHPGGSPAATDLGLDFLGFRIGGTSVSAASYRARFPDDRTLCDLDHWHRFRDRSADTFAQMYQFWVRSKRQ